MVTPSSLGIEGLHITHDHRPRDRLGQGMESPGFDLLRTAATMVYSQQHAVSYAAIRRISRCRVHGHLQVTFTECREWLWGLLSREGGKALVCAGAMCVWSHGLWVPITVDQLRPTALTCEAGKSLAMHACTSAIDSAQFLPFLPGMVPLILPNPWYLVLAPNFCLYTEYVLRLRGL